MVSPALAKFPAPVTVPPTAQTHVAVGEEPEVLRNIRRPEINLALWRRALTSPVARFARACLSSAHLHFGFEAASDAVAPKLSTALAGSGAPRRDAAAWMEDVVRLASLFAAATGARDLSVHVEVLAHDSCRLFHVDNVRCRLITTYAGAGTQWLRDGDVDRTVLGCGANSGVLRSGARVQRMQSGWVGLFKGERLPEMEGRGIVHRSAPVRATGRRRLVVKIGHAGEIACN